MKTVPTASFAAVTSIGLYALLNGDSYDDIVIPFALAITATAFLLQIACSMSEQRRKRIGKKCATLLSKVNSKRWFGSWPVPASMNWKRWLIFVVVGVFLTIAGAITLEETNVSEDWAWALGGILATLFFLALAYIGIAKILRLIFGDSSNIAATKQAAAPQPKTTATNSTKKKTAAKKATTKKRS